MNLRASARDPKKLDPRTPRQIISMLLKIKDKERILKAASLKGKICFPLREKETVTYKGVPIRLSPDLSKENLPSQAREIDFQEVQEAQRVPKKLDPRKHTHQGTS